MRLATASNRTDDSAALGLGLRARLGLSLRLLRLVWLGRGREELAEGGVEQLLVVAGLAPLRFGHGEGLAHV